MENSIERTLIRQEIGGTQQQAVDGRSLHTFLGNGDKFATWMANRVQQYGFVEGTDFATFSENTEKVQIGRPTKEYALSTDMAKELCMVERTAKGKEARQYYIGLEKKAMALVGDLPKTYTQALRLAADLNEKTEKQAAVILELQPKANFHDRVANQIDCQNMGEVAKAMGIGSGRLWRFLHEQHIVFREGNSNVPYQKYLERGYFKVIQKTFKDGHAEERGYTQTLVTGKGKIWIQQKWDDAKGLAKAA